MAGQTDTSDKPTRAGHRLGSGPGNVYVHAVSRRSPAAGPVAICGHPLRAARAGIGSSFDSDEPFEEFAPAHRAACPECARILDVEVEDLGDVPSDDEGMRGLIFNRVSGATAIATLVGLMAVARLALLLLR